MATPPEGSASRPPRAPSFAFAVGDRIAGRYRVLARLGVGGMATVYAAEDGTSGREVAVKVVHPHLVCDPVCVTRFEREARAAAAVRHPNVVGIVDVGKHGEHPFFAMERLRGASVAEALERGGAFDVARACRVAEQVLAGLAAVHAVGVVHRDVKADNVVLAVGPAGGEIARLLDFGIAAFVENQQRESDRLTPSGRAMGTPSYASPEQIAGAAVGPRADLYSVGVLLFEMATGERPFRAAGFGELCEAVLERPAPPMRVFRPGLPEAFEAAVARALRKDPGERFADAGRMAAAVARARVAL